jgi:hypothetical protein
VGGGVPPQGNPRPPQGLGSPLGGAVPRSGTERAPPPQRIPPQGLGSLLEGAVERSETEGVHREPRRVPGDTPFPPVCALGYLPLSEGGFGAGAVCFYGFYKHFVSCNPCRARALPLPFPYAEVGKGRTLALRSGAATGEVGGLGHIAPPEQPLCRCGDISPFRGDKELETWSPRP